ncbi:hypothetical protein L3Y34_012693 [Caenorhabditis briggsae]|uniref:Uncharacterized protein n=1 Tax=Caenorhabditis briggsae TaxID=6238 RepID=A0AAE9CVT3_CAEBR|nr:hypothetical protein L3Y34_012693 [Caenorhabditis briggsae]
MDVKNNGMDQEKAYNALKNKEKEGSGSSDQRCEVFQRLFRRANKQTEVKCCATGDVKCCHRNVSQMKLKRELPLPGFLLIAHCFCGNSLRLLEIPCNYNNLLTPRRKMEERTRNVCNALKNKKEKDHEVACANNFRCHAIVDAKCCHRNYCRMNCQKLMLKYGVGVNDKKLTVIRLMRERSLPCFLRIVISINIKKVELLIVFEGILSDCLRFRARLQQFVDFSTQSGTQNKNILE